MIPTQDLATLLATATIHHAQCEARCQRAEDAVSAAEAERRRANVECHHAYQLVDALRSMLWDRGLDPDVILQQ